MNCAENFARLENGLLEQNSNAALIRLPVTFFNSGAGRPLRIESMMTLNP
jgi:hypothetical protein